MKHLTTFDGVITALGGITAVARLTRRSPGTVCNWRRFTGTFPPRLYFVMCPALRRKGFTADRALWGFEDVIGVRAA